MNNRSSYQIGVSSPVLIELKSSCCVFNTMLFSMRATHDGTINIAERLLKNQLRPNFRAVLPSGADQPSIRSSLVREGARL
ncbi:MAG: hypothetical protein GKR97_15860 [Rhizobiaceae bacterium]|nr:hypothetical protein [Rhizobiaceae bacterium]